MALTALTRQVTVLPVCQTIGGTLAVTAPAANTLIVGIFVLSAPAEFKLRGVTLANAAATAGSIRYDMGGYQDTTAALTGSVVLQVVDSAVNV